MPDKVIEPAIETEEWNIGLEDPLVKEFLDLKQKYEVQQNRLEKIQDLEEDYNELEALQDRLPQSPSPQMKASILFKLLKIYDQELVDLPKIKPTGNVLQATDRNLYDALKEQIFEDVGMEQAWKDVLNGFKAEGTVLLQVGFDKDTGELSLDKTDLAECYFDSTLSKLCTKGSARGKRIRTIIRTVTMKYSEFIDNFPEWEGKVAPGDPSNSTTKYRDVFENFSNGDFTESDELTVYYCYSVSKSQKPVELVIAGGLATIISKKEGKAYPYYEVTSTGAKRPYLPFIDYHFTTVKRGFYSLSMIGMMKDISESYRKALNAALPVFHKQVNPILLLFGATDERVKEEIKLAQELQTLGRTRVVPVGQQGVSMGTLSPQGNIFTDFQNFRQQILNDAGMRFDINFQALEEVEQTATEFVGKTKTEVKAVTALYKINKLALSATTKYLVQLAVNNLSTQDPRVLKFNIDEENEEEIGFGELLGLIKGSQFDFMVDTDLRMPVSTVDKATALDELNAEINNVFYARPFTSAEEIELEIDLLHEKASMRDLDHIFTKQKLKQKASLILQARQELTPQQPVEGQGQALPEDVQRELSPNSFLAEANLEPAI